jgi:hypothetical protein
MERQSAAGWLLSGDRGTKNIQKYKGTKFLLRKGIKCSWLLIICYFIPTALI